MNESALTEKLISFLIDISPATEITKEDLERDLEDLGYDSLDRATFLLSIEEELDVKIQNEDLDNLTTLDSYVKFIIEQS